MDVGVRRPQRHEHLGHERGVVIALGLTRDEGVERGSLIRRQSGDEVLDQRAAATVRRQRAERIERDEPGCTFRVGDGDVHPEMRTPGMADQPGPIPAEMVEHGDRVGDVGLDVARPDQRARLEAALLGQDAVDQAIELLDEADQLLGPDARAAMEQQCPCDPRPRRAGSRRSRPRGRARSGW